MASLAASKIAAWRVAKSASARDDRCNAAIVLAMAMSRAGDAQQQQQFGNDDPPLLRLPGGVCRDEQPVDALTFVPLKRSDQITRTVHDPVPASAGNKRYGSVLTLVPAQVDGALRQRLLHAPSRNQFGGRSARRAAGRIGFDKPALERGGKALRAALRLEEDAVASDDIAALAGFDVLKNAQIIG